MMAPTAVDYMNSEDPFSAFIKPPPNEPPADREKRLRREHSERLASELIDAQIAKEAEARADFRRHNPELRLLLLGQAESGKSTLLKQFQMLYAPHTLDAERAAWRGVVFLNIIKTLRAVCEAHDFEYGSSNHSTVTFDPWTAAYTPPASPKGSNGRDNIAAIKLHIAPLLGLESTLAQRIGAGFNLAGRTEFCVRRGWQDNSLFSRPNTGKKKGRSRSGSADADRGVGNGKAPESELHLDVQMVLADCRPDIQALWAHPSLKVLVQRRRLRLEDASVFFLDEINRITQPGYLPSDDDILRARIRTIGISEWSFQFTYPGKKNLCNWRLFDVGGARSQRAHWAPYFEDATAIVFLAPISAYDQYLEEDTRTNRIDDSLQLWTQITSSPILKEVHLVLFLNKCDVLRGKLDAGVKVKKYITSYGDRPNEYGPVSHYFRAHFTQVFKRNNTESKRELYCHLTSVIDTEATQSIILSVRDGLFRANLKQTGLI
ncbi:guanine nucleotide-binding protein alpha subunit [Rhizoctonia solani 123E]|uniref:Guanine nucleotide-binding protein alpha subunit n=1 Tax=Rhizoctonia solani 123E TaxID=1423351 RepID=A0A074SGY4_9AGAM|nr:guanine nucleotide-binding protein alpha subunit [Rhizoctonia solani 123E]